MSQVADVPNYFWTLLDPGHEVPHHLGTHRGMLSPLSFGNPIPRLTLRRESERQQRFLLYFMRFGAAAGGAGAGAALD